MEILINVEDTIIGDVYEAKKVVFVDFFDEPDGEVIVVLLFKGSNNYKTFKHGREIAVDRKHVTFVNGTGFGGYSWFCTCKATGSSKFERMARQDASDHVTWSVQNNR